MATSMASGMTPSRKSLVQPRRVASYVPMCRSLIPFRFRGTNYWLRCRRCTHDEHSDACEGCGGKAHEMPNLRPPINQLGRSIPWRWRHQRRVGLRGLRGAPAGNPRGLLRVRGLPRRCLPHPYSRLKMEEPRRTCPQCGEPMSLMFGEQQPWLCDGIDGCGFHQWVSPEFETHLPKTRLPGF